MQNSLKFEAKVLSLYQQYNAVTLTWKTGADQHEASNENIK